MESYLVIKDYCSESQQENALDMLKNELRNLSADELLETDNIIRILGYSSSSNMGERIVYARGYRALTKIPRLPIVVIDNLITHFGKLSNIVHASIDELDQVDGIGEIRAKAVNDGLRRIREQVFFERHI